MFRCVPSGCDGHSLEGYVHSDNKLGGTRSNMQAACSDKSLSDFLMMILMMMMMMMMMVVVVVVMMIR